MGGGGDAKIKLPATVEVSVVGTVLVSVPAVIVVVDGGGGLLAESVPADEQPERAAATNAAPTGRYSHLALCPGRTGWAIMPITVAVTSGRGLRPALLIVPRKSFRRSVAQRVEVVRPDVAPPESLPAESLPAGRSNGRVPSAGG